MSVVKKELARRELAKRDYLSFVQYMMPGYQSSWHNIKLCKILDAFMDTIVAKGEPRIILSLPPRSGKSELVSRKLAPYLLGHHPKWDAITASYGAELSDQFGRQVRDTLNDPAYQDLFDVKLDTKTNAADLVKTQSGGMFKVTSVGGSLTGLGAHALIIDDPIKDRADADSLLMRDRLWDWYSSVARTRLHPGGGIIVCMTRWNTDDLVGRLLEQQRTDPNSDRWIVYDFPAIAIEDEEHRKIGEALHPERYPIESLLRTKASLQPRDWLALYQGKPYNESGNFFKKENIKFWKTLPSDLTWLIAADYAVSKNPRGDKTAIVALGVDHAGNVYLGDDYYWGRWETMDIVTKTVSLGKKYDSRQLATENGPINATINPLLQREMAQKGHYMTLEKNIRRGNKMISAHALRGLMEAGNFYFPDTPDCHERIIPNVLRFDDGSDGDDDFVDALTNGAVVIDNVGKPLPPEKPKDEPWRKRGELYSDDIFKKKDKKEIKGLRGQW